MSFQVRVGGQGGRAYSVERDIVTLFQRICHHSFINLAAHSWHTSVREWAAQSGLTQEHLVEAAACMRNFINLATHVDLDDFADVWIRAGFDKVSTPALVATFHQIGMTTLAAWYNSVRQAVRMGQLAPHADQMCAVADRAIHAMREGSERKKAQLINEAAKEVAKAVEVDQHLLDGIGNGI